MMDIRNCPKHVEFHSKNKFEKLVNLDGFIIINCLRKFIRVRYRYFSLALSLPCLGLSLYKDTWCGRKVMRLAHKSQDSNTLQNKEKCVCRA